MSNGEQIIKSFVVFFTNGEKLKKEIYHFYLVEEYIYHHGTHTIKKIIFDFNILNQNREYFPYGIHNIIIENTFINNWFTIHFYHYYNCLNEKRNIPIEQQKTDYYIIQRFLSSTYCIFYYLGRWIMNPFPINNTEIVEEKEIVY